MVVLVILGLLAGLVGPRLFGKVDQSKVQTAQTQIKMLRGALQGYRLDIGRYPSSAEGLAALMRAPPDVAAYWIGPYLEDELPLDPWRTPYRYEHRSTTSRALHSILSAPTRPTAARTSMPTSAICRERADRGRLLATVAFRTGSGRGAAGYPALGRLSPRRRPASLANGLPRVPIQSP